MSRRAAAGAAAASAELPARDGGAPGGATAAGGRDAMPAAARPVEVPQGSVRLPVVRVGTLRAGALSPSEVAAGPQRAGAPPEATEAAAAGTTGGAPAPLQEVDARAVWAELGARVRGVSLQAAVRAATPLACDARGFLVTFPADKKSLATWLSQPEDRRRIERGLAVLVGRPVPLVVVEAGIELPVAVSDVPLASTPTGAPDATLAVRPRRLAEEDIQPVPAPPRREAGAAPGGGASSAPAPARAGEGARAAGAEAPHGVEERSPFAGGDDAEEPGVAAEGRAGVGAAGEEEETDEGPEAAAARFAEWERKAAPPRRRLEAVLERDPEMREAVELVCGLVKGRIARVNGADL